MKKENITTYQDVISADYQNGRFIFYERNKAEEDKAETSFVENAKKLVMAKGGSKELYGQLQELLKKHGVKGRVSMENSRDEPRVFPLQLGNGKRFSRKNNGAMDKEYLSMDGDMDDSINDSMEIQGPLSQSTKDYLKRTARQMRQIDSEIGLAVERGETEQANLLTNQWDMQRASMLYYLQSSRIRVNPGKKKNKKKIMTKALDNEEKNEKKRGIHRKKSRGLSRERVRESPNSSY